MFYNKELGKLHRLSIFKFLLIIILNTMKYIAFFLFVFLSQICNAQFKGIDRTLRADKTTYQFNPKQNSNIVFIGNSFADRLKDYNYFEALLYKSFHERNLTIRNFGWSADEVGLRPRPLNFGSLDEHLSRRKADIIFAYYGLNEAFKGPENLSAFKQKLRAFLKNIQSHKYNGKT